MSRWWSCFVCGSRRECAHREQQLVTWMRSLERSTLEAERDRYRRELERKPPAREVAKVAGTRKAAR